MQKIKILIADDHKILQEGVSQALESQSDLEVIAQASTGKEALDLVRKLIPDVVLLDINMPGIDGLEVTKVIKSEFSNIGVIILTMFKRDDYVFRAIDAGANGYLLKEAEMDELISAVRKVAVGESVIDPALTNRVFAKLRGDLKPEIDKELKSLSKRDVEILKLVAQGLSNQEIAGKVFITEKTVRNRLSLIFRQLGLKNRTEAALFAIEKGLTERQNE